MSSNPSRKLEIWKSSLIRDLVPIHGAFYIKVTPFLMIPQSIQFFAETLRASQSKPLDQLLEPFRLGMQYLKAEEGNDTLIWAKNFEQSDSFHNFDISEVFKAVKLLETHLDTSFHVVEVNYLADLGRGPEKRIMKIQQVPLGIGAGFEIEDRGAALKSLEVSLKFSNVAEVAQSHYKTGVTMFLIGDQAGTIDAAFMQFYQAIEAVLETYKLDEAVANGKSKFGADFPEKTVRHVFSVRHKFFAHIRAADSVVKRAKNDPETAQTIAKQVLIARWCARQLINLELGGTLVNREYRLHPIGENSIHFDGDDTRLDVEFKIPDT